MKDAARHEEQPNGTYNVTLYVEQPHLCNLGSPDSHRVHKGTLRQCFVCLRWYVNVLSDYGRCWKRVRWYHRKENRLIQQYYDGEINAGR